MARAADEPVPQLSPAEREALAPSTPSGSRRTTATRMPRCTSPTPTSS